MLNLNNLKFLRQDKHLTLRELSEKTNIDKSTLSRYERGEQEIKSSDLTLLSTLYNVSSDYLLGLSKEKNSVSNAKEKLNGVQLAFYNQAGEITDQQAKEVLQFIEFIKKRDKNN